MLKSIKEKDVLKTMIAVYLSPIYILSIIYIIRHFYRMTTAFSQVLRKKWFIATISIIFLFFASTPVLASFLPDLYIRKLIRPLSTYWLGCLLYLALFLLIFDVILYILKKAKIIRLKFFATRKFYIAKGVCVLSLAAAVSVYGFIHATDIKTTTYNVDIKKSCKLDTLKIALVSDLHLGYSIGIAHTQKMVDAVNAMDPDIVVFAGDFFDNSYDSIEEPDEVIEVLKGIKSRYGTYACWGNHDVSETILVGFTFRTEENKTQDERMYEFLKKANINILRDETVLIDDSFYLCGRLDSQKPGSENGSRLTPVELMKQVKDHTKPVIVMDHQPRQLQELADVGVDIDLSGHTHDGQIFPGNILTDIMWENSCGMIQKDNMYSIVTSGVGVYGPFMRVGTDAEVVEVNVKFA